MPIIRTMHGLHLLADLDGCDAAAPVMTDAAALRALCLRCVAEAGLTPVADAFHHFGAAGGGVTCAVLLAESHLAVHTWPELGAATLDVYVCNFGADNSGRARELLASLTRAFAPARTDVRAVPRGGAAR